MVNKINTMDIKKFRKSVADGLNIPEDEASKLLTELVSGLEGECCMPSIEDSSNIFLSRCDDFAAGFPSRLIGHLPDDLIKEWAFKLYFSGMVNLMVVVMGDVLDMSAEEISEEVNFYVNHSVTEGG